MSGTRPTVGLHVWRLVVLASGVILLTAGVTKLFDIAGFSNVLEKQAAIGGWLLPVAAVTIPLTEVAVGAFVTAIVLRPSRKCVMLGSIASGLLFFGFAGYALILTLRPPPEPTSCGCLFSGPEIADWTPLLIRNLLISFLLVAMPLLLAYTSATPSADDGPSTP